MTVAGRSAHRRATVERRRARWRRVRRDAVIVPLLASLPVATHLLTRAGVSRLEAVGIAAFVALLAVGWRRGASVADADRARRWSLGADAEARTAQALADLARRRDAVVLHDLRLPGRRENVDHVVIDGAGVLVVETKRWSGRVVAGRRLRVNGERRDAAIAQVERLVRAVTDIADAAGIAGVSTAGALCVHGTSVRTAWWRRRPEVRGVRVATPDQLVRWVGSRRRRARGLPVRRSRRLRRREIAALATALGAGLEAPVG